MQLACKDRRTKQFWQGKDIQKDHSMFAEEDKSFNICIKRENAGNSHAQIGTFMHCPSFFPIFLKVKVSGIHTAVACLIPYVV